MHDSELKKLLLETHPVRPGQEDRAWGQLKGRFSTAEQIRSLSLFMGWRTGLATCALIVIAILAGDFLAMRPYPGSFASAASQAPGIYATAFYSHSAHAQVVWINGMEPASDQLSYMDPTMVVAGADASQPARDPNGL
jgi:hypothetical protein